MQTPLQARFVHFPQCNAVGIMQKWLTSMLLSNADFETGLL